MKLYFYILLFFFNKKAMKESFQEKDHTNQKNLEL